MNDLTDQQLLRDYVERQSETAFAELVRRHVDLIYSAALRMVCDSHFAKDVTQAVFLALAQNARQLTDRPVLSGWLHRTAQNIASKSVRTEVRRRAREQEAVAMNELLTHESDTGWENIAPHLDTALGELSESDRDALLLRYFERKSAREMALALNVSEEAAQKRVNRAVERLREFFVKRNVTIGASGLVVLISANAVQAAPVGVIAMISTGVSLAGTAVQTSTAIAATTKSIAMTTLQKTLITAAIVVATGVGVYEANRASNLQKEIQMLRQEQVPSIEQTRQLQLDRENLAQQLVALHEENERLNRNNAELLKLRGEVGLLRRVAQDLKQVETGPLLIAAKSWLEKVDVLKNWIEERPEQQIPEFQYLQDYDWLDAVKTSNMLGDNAPLNAMRGLRERAKRQFAHEMMHALRRFVEEHNGYLPADLSQLNAYFKQPMNDAILKSYKLLHLGRLADLPKGEWLVSEIAPPFDGNDDRE